MKKIILLFSILILASTVKSQITLEYTFYRHNTEFYITDLGNNELKYIFLDTTGFRIYNLDYSLFQYVNTPFHLEVAPYSYVIAYVTRSLFDCDSSNIEYVITSPFNGGNFYIYRTDGTMLFEKDSVTGPFQLNAADGSVWQKPIFDTPTGTKLWLFNPFYQDSIWAYSLCGSLPLNVLDFTGHNSSSIELYPNPTTGRIIFKVNLPDNLNEYELKINDINGNEIYREKIISQKEEYIFDAKELSGGTYFYCLSTKNRPFKAGKFIIAK
jgi:hypothetical protein